MPLGSTERQRRIEAEIERLEDVRQSLEREWTRLPWLLIAGVLAIPAFFIWGVGSAILVLLAVLSLYGTAAYLVGVRRRETQGEIEDMRGDLERIRHGF